MLKFIAFFCLFICLGGCAVLTPSQVTEVKSFSTASTALADMPSHVIEEHAEIRTTAKTARASESSNGDRAWKVMQEGLELEKELKEKADRVQVACGVLKNYAELLVRLSSDDASDNLQQSADRIGGKLDDSIDEFNAAFGRNIDTLGGEVAALVRGVGGLYIKRKQTQALQRAVQMGQPIVNQMSAEIEQLLMSYIKDEKSFSLLASERADLISWFENVGYRQNFPSAVLIRKGIQRSMAAEQYAEGARRATMQMCDAHEKLVDLLSSKRDLSGTVELVSVYVKEVEEAKSLYDVFKD